MKPARDAAAAAVSAQPERRRPGRPRSGQADQAIITAALDLFAENGPAGLRVEQVAARAGVGKATIYRRWAGKEDLLLDALGALETVLPTPRGRSVRSDLMTVLAAICQDLDDPRRARESALLQGEGRQYPRLMSRYWQAVVEPRRDVIRSVLHRGVATGELREDADIEAATLMLSGAVAEPARPSRPRPDSQYLRRVVDALLRGLAAR